MTERGVLLASGSMPSTSCDRSRRRGHAWRGGTIVQGILAHRPGDAARCVTTRTSGRPGCARRPVRGSGRECRSWSCSRGAPGGPRAPGREAGAGVVRAHRALDRLPSLPALADTDPPRPSRNPLYRHHTSRPRASATCGRSLWPQRYRRVATRGTRAGRVRWGRLRGRRRHRGRSQIGLTRRWAS